MRVSVRRRAGPSLPLAKDLNEALAYFVTDLLACWDRKAVFDAVSAVLRFSRDGLVRLTLAPGRWKRAWPGAQVHRYLEALTVASRDTAERPGPDGTTVAERCASLRFDFLRIVCGYEHFVALNLPLGDLMEKPFEKLARFPKDL